MGVTTSVRLDFVAAVIVARLVPLAMSRRQPVGGHRAAERRQLAGELAELGVGSLIGGPVWSRSSRHSPMARNTSTATMLIPPAAIDRADEDAESERQATVAVALQPHEAVADQPAGQAAEADRREGGSTRRPATAAPRAVGRASFTGRS